MKLILLVSLALAACGPANQFCEINGKQLNGLCYNPEQDRNDNQDRDISLIKSQITQLEAQNLLNVSRFNDITQSIDSIVDSLESNSEDINTLYTLLSALQVGLNTTNTNQQTLISQYNQIQTDIEQNVIDISDIANSVAALAAPISALETNVQTNTTNIAILQGYTHITEVLNPCGDHPTKIDEVFLRMNNGSIVASFSDNSSGLNTRFSIIEPSNTTIYSTTDGTSCLFKVMATGINSGKVCFGSGYGTCI